MHVCRLAQRRNSWNSAAGTIRRWTICVRYTRQACLPACLRAYLRAYQDKDMFMYVCPILHVRMPACVLRRMVHLYVHTLMHTWYISYISLYIYALHENEKTRRSCSISSHYLSIYLSIYDESLL